jgi:hypothetical protein
VAVDVPLFEGGRVQLGRAPPEKPSPDFVAGSAVMGPDSCRLNAESFAECGDRGRAWKLLGLLSPSSPAIREAARYYQRGGDYQMCALVAAVFGLKGFDGEVRRYGRERKKELMFRAMVAPAEGAAFSFWGGDGRDDRERELETLLFHPRGGETSLTLLLCAHLARPRRYAEALYAWGFLGARLELLKRTGAGSEEMGGVGIGIGTLCSGCGEEKEKGEFCKSCRVFKSRCSICNFRVRGAATACLDCTHGGCLGCMEQWFKEHDECPTGCGCRCKERQVRARARGVRPRNVRTLTRPPS